ncbi:hypothetical protein K474DRAFT_1680944 [Panus rudis PR-1116 ss-1]|nr:hypothetical protein K474DRAFT_1680944 [Panus rudis PR-1116 ss-1]
MPKGVITRAKNKDTHPGAPDMPQSRRSHQEVTEAKAAEADVEAAKKKVRDAAMSEAADAEAEILQEDAAFEAQARRAPTPEPAAKVKPRPKRWSYGDLEPGTRPLEFESEDEGYVGQKAVISSSDDSEVEQRAKGGKKKKERLLRNAIGKARGSASATNKRKEASPSPERSVTG